MPRVNPPGPDPLTTKMVELLRKVPGADTVGKAVETMTGPENPRVHMALQVMNRADPYGLMSMGMPMGMAVGKLPAATAEAAAAKAIRGYHGTDAATDFAKFGKTNDFGYHFAANPQAAESRLLTEGAGKVGKEFAPGARIIPADLNIQNPVRLPDLKTWDKPKTLQALVDANVITKEQMATEMTMGKVADPKLAKEMWQESLQGLLKDKGYDGVVYKNAIEGGGDSYIALHPDQIKMGVFGGSK